MVKFLFTAVLTAFFYSPFSYSDEIDAVYRLNGTCYNILNGESTVVSDSSVCQSVIDSYLQTLNPDFSTYIYYDDPKTWFKLVGFGSNRGVFTPTEDGSYYCDDPDYPILTPENTCSDGFIIDQDVIDAYTQTMEEFAGTASIMSADTDTKGEAVEDMADRFNELLLDTAKSNSMVDSLDDMLSSAADSLMQYPESNVVESAYNELADISFDANSNYANATSTLETISELTTELSSNYNSQQTYLDNLTYSIGNLDTITELMSECDGSYCWDSYVEFADDEISEGNEAINNYDVISSIDTSMTETNLQEQQQVLEDILDAISTGYDKGTSIINEISNYNDYGETCVGETCVANPSPEEEETQDDPLYELPTDSENLKFNEILDESTLSELQTNIANKETEYQELIDSFGTLFSSDSFQIADSGYIDNVHDMYGTSIDLGSKQMETLFTQYNLQYIIWFIVVLAGLFILFGVSR